MPVGEQGLALDAAESRGLAGLGQLPAFDLPAAGGGRVRSWDYKGRRHLVLWLTGDAPDRRALDAAARRESLMQAEGAVFLVILQASRERAEQTCAAAGLRGPVLADQDGRIHTRLAGDRPVLLVADRNGTVYWRAPVLAGLPDFDEAISWLQYLNILEPECGTCVPAWPVE